MSDNKKLPKHLHQKTSWPQPHPELMRLASNVEYRFYDIMYNARDLLQSAHKYRYELAELEKRDNPDAINKFTKKHEGAWNQEIDTHESEDARDPEDEPFDPDEITRDFVELMDGCSVLIRAAQGKSLGKEIAPWMFQGHVREQVRRAVLRQGHREIEKAFIECISDMLLYIGENGHEMASSSEPKNPREQQSLLKHHNMTYDEHFSQLIHRVEKLKMFHDQYDDGYPFAEEFGDIEEYDNWVHQALLSKLGSKAFRTSVAGIVREQRKACEEYQDDRDQVSLDDTDD